jgi:PAS domain S-box-containing protein
VEARDIEATEGRASRMDHEAYLRMLDEARALDADAEPRTTVARAAGLLAGRVGCRVREAQVHLLDIAREQGREPAEVAEAVLAVLETEAASPESVRSTVAGALRAGSRRAAQRRSGPRRAAERRTEPLASVVQEMLDALSGAHWWMVPVRDEAGEVLDFEVQAASPEALDSAGRQGAQLIGVRVRERYPQIVKNTMWERYLRVLADGKGQTADQVISTELAEGVPAQSRYSVRVYPLGPGLLVSWSRQDDETRRSERIAQTERLGNLGWGEWDMTTGEVVWSDQIYRIYERDPSLGPPSAEESAAMNLPEEDILRAQAAETFGRGETTDVTTRVRVNGRIKHIRAVADAVRDASGRPLKIYGIVQDVTAREAARERLAEVERELRAHQRDLEAEHRLAARLQQIILPIPEEPIDLPGLRVAVRYLPAERASRVGGDWFHAAALPDGAVLLAIGDVAGHGLAAATTMAQLRHALAALTVTTTADPAELLSHLNRLLYASAATAGATGTATAVIARFDPSAKTLTWAQAGHPAPLRARGGVATALRRPKGPLLGASPHMRYERATVPFEVGDLLLLYTDGLIERRGSSPQQGLVPVIETLEEISAARSEQPLADLLMRLRRANPNDDTCIVAARPAPAG